MTRLIGRRSSSTAARWRGLLAASFVIAGCMSSAVRAEEAPTDGASAAPTPPSDESAQAPAAQTPFTLELGDFYVRDWRPTRNETPSLRFAVAAVFAADVPASTRKQLTHWVNRLRDQTIIAVRLAETKDFAEPGLGQFQRLIAIRISRVLPHLPVEGVLITDFAYGDE